MKSLQQIAIAILFLTVSFNVAVAGGNKTSTVVSDATALKQQVQNLITFSYENGLDVHGDIEVDIRINEFGRIEVLRTRATHFQVANEITRDLKNQRLNVAAPLAGKVYRMKMSYGI